MNLIFELITISNFIRTTCEIYDISTTADIGDCPPTLDLVNSSDLSLLATKPCSEFLKPTLINKGKSSNSVGITKQQQSISTSKNVLTVNNQHYQFIRVLGEGGSSKVYEVMATSTQTKNLEIYSHE